MKNSRKKKPAERHSPPPKKAPETGPSRLSRRKLWGFRLLVAVGFPLALLSAIELFLRLAGFGYPTGFFLSSERDGQKVLVQNNRFTWRFFGPAMARIPEPICLPKVKGTNTVRVIVFGESAALGDPQPRFGLARMLQAMLELRYPHTHFEVVNAGIVAINSNVILPLARDCERAGADIWVIYMGNNEVVGPFGAGTVFGQQALPLPLIRANLALKATRIGQLLDQLRGEFHKPPLEKSEWGGMEMFLNQQVSADDPRMQAVYDHFGQNLAAIIQAARRAAARVVVSTVAVNLRDCAPFVSAHRRGLTEPDKNNWVGLYRKGIAAQTAGRFGEAADWYRQAAQIDDEYAELHYRAGVCSLALGQTVAAQEQFVLARDQDTLRFRCDSHLNKLIRQTVSNYSGERVVLGDAEQALAADSLNGLPGDDLFYEHVHLTFDGNYLVARTLAHKLGNLLPKEVATQVAGSQPWPTETDCARRLAYGDWDRQQALTEIFSRLGKPPFNGQLNHEAKVQNLKAALDKLLPATQPAGIRAAQNLCENALAVAPDDPLLREQLATLEESTGDLPGAATNAQRALDLLPNSSADASKLGVILAKQHQYEEAITAFRRAFELDAHDAWALQNLAQALNDLGRHDEAMREYRHALEVNPRFGLAWLGLGQILEDMGHKDEAEDCYRKAVQNRIKRPTELRTLAHFCENHGWREAAATNYDDALALNPSDATLYIEAGQNLAALERHAEAEQRYAEAIKLVPDSMQAHFLYGMELGREGKPAEAAAQFREAVRIMPNLAEARLNLGVALQNQGNNAEALAQFEQVLEKNPGNAMATTHAQALRQQVKQAR
jgi:tetratricopeptide (TPR) repeat protein